MYINNYMGKIIARDYHQTALKDAEHYRWQQQQKSTASFTSWRQLRWQISRSVFGTAPRLQPQPEA